MNIHEIIQNVGDLIWDRVSDPERIAEFSAHTEDCQRTQPLWKNIKASGTPPSWSSMGLGFQVDAIEMRCGECGGITTKIFE